MSKPPRVLRAKKRDQQWAEGYLPLIAPFDTWKAKAARDPDDEQMYHRIVMELEALAAGYASAVEKARHDGLGEPWTP